MEALLLLLLGITVIAFLIGYIRNARLNKQIKKGLLPETSKTKTAPEATCCGQHGNCEKRRIINAFAQHETIYYDDEELDIFKDRDPHSYTTAEIQQFREIKDTMRAEEVEGWIASLYFRHVQLPTILQGEIGKQTSCNLLRQAYQEPTK